MWSASCGRSVLNSVTKSSKRACCWRLLAPGAAYLRGRGHRVFTPSLTGVGDRAHLARPGVTLSTHVADIVDVAESGELKGAILVAHSYSGVPCVMAAERIGDRIRRLVFLDSVLPEAGKPLSSLSDPKLWDARAAAAQATPANGFPPPPMGRIWDIRSGSGRWLERQLRPQPIGTYVEAPKLMKPVRAAMRIHAEGSSHYCPLIDQQITCSRSPGSALANWYPSFSASQTEP
jgi:pimeloyl-ACP methyl ester carboxylesterase